MADQPPANCEVCLAADADGKMTLTIHYFPDPPLSPQAHEDQHRMLWDLAMGVLTAQGIPPETCAIRIKRVDRSHEHPPSTDERQRRPQEKRREQEN